MIAYKPVPFKVSLGQSTAPAVPPPSPDPLYTGYTGIAGVIEMLAVLGITGLAAYSGIKGGLKETNKTQKAIDLTYGIGSALLGLLYLGGKSGLNQTVSLPAVRVTPN